MYRIFFCVFAALLSIVHEAGAEEQCDFRLDRTKVPEISFSQSLKQAANANLGFWRSIREAPDDVKTLGRFVGRLDICFGTKDDRPVTFTDPLANVKVTSNRFVGHCTATLLPNNRLITAHHCYFSKDVKNSDFSRLIAAKVHFGFETADFTTDVLTVNVAKNPIAKHEELDALVLQIEGTDANAALGGFVQPLLETDPKANDALLVVHHPYGQPQRFSSGTCQIDREQSDLPPDAPVLRHRCETFKGSSGALIFDPAELTVVGMHQAASTSRDNNGRMTGYNVGTKLVDINAALGLGFETRAAAEVRLTKAATIADVEARKAELENLAKLYPGTRVAAKAELLLTVLPVLPVPEIELDGADSALKNDDVPADPPLEPNSQNVIYAPWADEDDKVEPVIADPIVTTTAAQEAWAFAKVTDTQEAYEAFIRDFPNTELAAEARTILNQSRFNWIYRGLAKTLQSQLKEESCYSGGIDGLFGSASQAALKKLVEKMPADCKASAALGTVQSRSVLPDDWIGTARRISARINECVMSDGKRSCAPPKPKLLNLSGFGCPTYSYGSQAAMAMRQRAAKDLYNRLGCNMREAVVLKAGCNGGFHQRTSDNGPWGGEGNGFAPRNTVFFYSSAVKSKAEELAIALRTSLGVPFVAARGGGLCFNSKFQKNTLIVHIRDDR